MLCFSLKLNPLRTRRKGEAPNLFDNYLKFTSIDEDGAFIGVPSFRFKLSECVFQFSPIPDVRS